MDKGDTKQHILDVAERLFAEKGYAATSLRAITQAAEVNLGAVNYHFVSKENLIGAVFGRRLGPINERRLRLLEACESAAQPPELEAIVHAFIAPVFLHGDSASPVHAAFPKLLARVYSEKLDSLIERQMEVYGPLLRRFHQSLSRALPDLPAEEVYWCMEFMVGILNHCLMSGDLMQTFTQGRCLMAPSRPIVDRMVRFTAAGMRAAEQRQPEIPTRLPL